MTREEAIEYNKNLREYMRITDKKSEYKFLKENYEALEMAIQALSQEPCGDAVSRQAVIDTIESWLSCDDYNEAERHIMRATQSVLYDLPSVRPQPCDDAISREGAIRKLRADTLFVCTGDKMRAISDIEGLPPVTPQPKPGHWIDDKCSVCGKGIEDLISSREWYRNEEPNFCPFCGLKLVETQKRRGEE